MSFRFHAPSQTIVDVWVNDEDTRRAYEGRNDAYSVFARMPANGHPPGDWAALLSTSQAIPPMTTTPLLYTYRRCPYAMRARMALLQAGVAFDAVEIVLRDKPADMLTLSPKGTVPVLRLPGGGVLEQSLDIVRWVFMETGDAEGWWARAQSTANMALLSVCDGVFKHHLDRIKYPERFDESAGSKAHHREQAVAVLLKPLNTQLQSTGQLGGHAPCAADIAILPFVRQFAAVDLAWFGALPLPALQRWLGGWLTEPLFHAAMSKLPANQALAFPSPPAA